MTNVDNRRSAYYARLAEQVKARYSYHMSASESKTPAGAEAGSSNSSSPQKRGVVELPTTAGVLTAVGTLALAVFTFVALHGRQQQYAVIALAFVVPGGLLYASRNYRAWPIVAPLAISLFAGMFALVGFGWWNSSHQVTRASDSRPEGNHKSTNDQSLVPALDINFLDPQPGDFVKQCPRIDGTGRIPAGYGLWIIVVPDTSMQPKQYWIESQAKAQRPDYWTAVESVSIDGRAVKKPISADIYAVLLDQEWSNYFAVSSATGNFSATSLPPTASRGIIGPVPVTRVSGTGTCR